MLHLDPNTFVFVLDRKETCAFMTVAYFVLVGKPPRYLWWIVGLSIEDPKLYFVNVQCHIELRKLGLSFFFYFGIQVWGLVEGLGKFIIGLVVSLSKSNFTIVEVDAGRFATVYQVHQLIANSRSRDNEQSRAIVYDARWSFVQSDFEVTSAR